MRGQAKWCWMVLAFVVGSGSAPAWAQKEAVGSWHAALAAGIYQPQEEDTDLTSTFGLRGGYRFHPELGFEAAVNASDLADTLPSEDESGDPVVDLKFDFFAINLDLSLQWFPKYAWSRNVIIFAGAGMSRIEADISGTIFDVPFTDKDLSTVFTAHAGAAYDWRFGERLFLRPELRYRYYADDDEFDSNDSFTIIYDASGPEANVILGWRFGS